MGYHKRCCPSDFEPGESCSTSLEYIPAHPSAASRRVCRTTGPLSVTTLAEGCEIDVTIGDSTIGRHPLSLSVTSSQPLWTALTITWFDQPTNLDPHVIGSFNRVQASGYLKLRDAVGWDLTELATDLTERSGPWLIGGAAIEQDGVIYVATGVSWADLLAANPCCWFGVGGGGVDSTDEPCRATRRAFAADLSTDDEFVVNGSGILCSDFFGRLMPDGTIDLDQRPDLNLGIAAHPVTRFGHIIGLSSCPAEIPTEDQGAEGTWSIAGVLGPLCGRVDAHGAGPYTAGTPTAPVAPGDLIIDEPLDTLPAGWTTGSLSRDDDGSHHEGGGAGGTFVARDGATFSEVPGFSGGEYASGTLYTEIPFARASWRTGTKLTIEWTHRRVRDDDRRFPLPDTHDPYDFRDQTNGFFIGGLFFWDLRHQNASRWDEDHGLGTTTPRYGYVAEGPLHQYGGKIVDNDLYTPFPVDWPWDADDSSEPPGLIQDVSRWQLAGEFGFDGRQISCGSSLIAPNDGDRVTLVVECEIQNQPNPQTDDSSDRVDVWIFTLQSWINGRLITPSDAVSDTSGSWFAVPPLTTLRMGLHAPQGGGWQDLTVRMFQPV